MLLTNARAFFLDEVSTGLDAAVTLHIFSALKQWCAINNSSVVVALLQPTPETYALFDDVILMRDGHCVFHGPRDDVAPWLWEIAGLEVPHGVDEAGFVVDYLNDPAQQYQLAAKLAAERLEDEAIQASPEHSRAGGKAHALGARRSSAGASLLQAPETGASPMAASSGPPQTLSIQLNGNGSAMEQQPTPSHVRIHLGTDDAEAAPVVVSASPAVAVSSPATNGRNGVLADAPARAKMLRTMASSSFAPQYHSHAGGSPVYDSDELFARYKSSPHYARLRAECSLAESSVAPLNPASWNAYTRATYTQRYPHSVARHTALNLSRQYKLTARNKTMVPPRMAQAVIMGVVFGTLFIQLAYDKFADRMGLLLYVVMAGAFANLTELPVASEARNVVSKQIDAGFFPSGSYSLSVAALHIPITLVECLIFGSCLYWIPGFYADAGRFFFFLLVLVLNSNAVSVLFRSISYVAKNPDIARQMGMKRNTHAHTHTHTHTHTHNTLHALAVGAGAGGSACCRWSGWGEEDVHATHFFFFFLLLFLAHFLPVDLPFIVIFIIFGGFLITFDKIPKWLLFLYYGSPFGWSVRSLAQNEFHSPKYDRIDPVTGVRDGDAFLSSFGVFTDPVWKWMGVLYLGAVYLLLLSLNALLLNSIKPVTPMGTKKSAPALVPGKNGADEDADAADGMVVATTAPGAAYAVTSNNGAGSAAAAIAGSAGATAGGANLAPVAASNNHSDSVRVSVGPQKKRLDAKQSFQLSALPFVPVTLAWRNINYSVEVGKGKEKHERRLLCDISGFAAPGRMTALMGSSGAGKTVSAHSGREGAIDCKGEGVGSGQRCVAACASRKLILPFFPLFRC